jgi:phage protein D
VSESLASIALPHLDQIDESDINLLTRVAREHDAIAKPGGGKLIVARRGESLTVTGDPMPRVALGPSDVSRWRWEYSLRPPAGQVVAVWHDPVSAEDVEVTAGDSEPVRRLRQRFPSEAAARAAAEAEFRRAERAGTQLSIALPGNPDLVAEGRVVLAGFRPEVDGDWLVRRVTHILDRGGYRCDVEAEVPE